MNKEEFNKEYPIGTPVMFYPLGGAGQGKETKTRSKCFEFMPGSLAVKVKGLACGVRIEHITKIIG